MTLEELQRTLLSMITVVDKLLQDNNIDYFLLDGSVLGAVRHNGFIPWDDDLDIGIKRCVFAKAEYIFGEYLPKGYLYEPIEKHLTDDAPIGKIRFILDRTLPLSEQPTIDVFVLEGAPSNLRQQKLQVIAGHIYNLCIYGHPSKNRGVLINCGTWLFILIIRGRLRKFISKIVLKYISQWRHEDTGYITNLYGYPDRKELVPAQFFEKAYFHKFAGLSLPIPCEYDKYLTMIYGDYMVLPPINKRVPVHKNLLYREATDNPIKILHFVSSLSINSGVMSVIMNYYRHIDRAHVQFDIMYYKNIPDTETYKKEFESLGGKTYLITKPHVSKNYIDSLHSFFSQHNGEWHAIHIHEVFLTFMLAPIARKYGLKIITHCHSTKFSDHVLHAIRNRILCLGINKNTDLRFACSKAAGLALYGKHTNFTIINNAIELDRFTFDQDKRAFIRCNLNIENKTVIGHVGRFSKQKNHKFLLEVFYEFHKIDTNSILLLVGEGPLADKVHSQVARLSLTDSVMFLGRRNDVANLYSAMDIFLLPSLFEGLPVIGIEAQASGLPCVVSDTVTKELRISDVDFVSLNKTAEEWADIVLKKRKISSREDAAEKVALAGYDINAEALKLQKLYLNLD